MSTCGQQAGGHAPQHSEALHLVEHGRLIFQVPNALDNRHESVVHLCRDALMLRHLQLGSQVRGGEARLRPVKAGCQGMLRLAEDPQILCRALGTAGLSQ